MTQRPPFIGITPDLHEGRLRVRSAYAEAIQTAGAVPIVLAPIVDLIPTYLDLCDAFVFTGGDDPIMEKFGEATHAEATKVEPQRQAFELALLDELINQHTNTPALGVCLGMQYMALAAGGRLDQHLPDTLATHDNHSNDRAHPLVPAPGVTTVSPEPVCSHHHQAITDPGRLRIIATAEDGVIEAIDDPSRPFFVGVQWHPERTPGHANGQAIFDALVKVARSSD